MKFLNLGGATGILEHKGIRILFDPWLDEGIFHGAWHHYPPVALPDNSIKSIGKVDYIYISHIHEDHCSLKTLQSLNREAEIIIMDRKPNFVLQFLEKHQLLFKKIHLIPPYQKMTINGEFEVAMVTADPAHELNYLIDSGLVINWDGHKIYNANDCPPYAEAISFIKNSFARLSLALLPYATGSSYPACFKNLSHDEKLKEKRRLYKMGMDIFLSSSAELQADFVMPFADQYVIVGNKYHLNQYMPHPSSPSEVRDFFKETPDKKLLLLNSFQGFDLDTGAKFPENELKVFTDEDRDKYALSHKDDLYDFEKFELSKNVNLTKLVQISAERLFSTLKKMNYSSPTNLVIEVYDWKLRFKFDLEKHQLTEMRFEDVMAPPYLQASVSSHLLELLLIGHISWNIADAALFIEYDRVPNNYDPKIHSFWNYIRI